MTQLENFEAMSSTQDIWNSENSDVWKRALDRYWSFVKDENRALEKELNQLDADKVRKMEGQEWYYFLLNRYYRWKYTAANRYATTTKFLKTYAEEKGVDALDDLKNQIFEGQARGIADGLKAALKLPGLGTAGASGLLSLLFPEEYGTVDQFVVQALLPIQNLPERELLKVMTPESLSPTDGLILIQIMSRKARELNEHLDTDFWTPRKVDMVLWATR